MVIVCEVCGARFRMNHALFRDAKGARIRCRKCGRHIEVRHPEASPLPPENPEPEKKSPMPEEAVFSPSVPVADTAPPIPQASASIEAEAGTAHSGHLEMLDPLMEEPFLPPAVAAAAPEPDSSREEHAAEMASLKRRLRASSRRGPSMLTLFLFVVPGILLLAGGAFFLRDTKLAHELLRKFFPPSGSGNTASAVEKPAYEIRNMESSYAMTFIGGDLFVIRGTVANVGKGPSRGIRVQATLLDKDNQALVNSTVFAANLVDNTTLRHSNRAVIEGFLGWRYGERNANRDIPAGTSLPFMVVFFDPPGKIEYFTVEAMDTE